VDLSLLSQPVAVLAVIGVLLLVIGIGLLLIINNRLKSDAQSDQGLSALYQKVVAWEADNKQFREQMSKEREQLTHFLYNQFGESKNHNLSQLSQQKHYVFQLFAEHKQVVESKLNEQLLVSQRSVSDLKENLTSMLTSQKEQFNKNQLSALSQLTEHLNSSTKQSREELSQSLQHNAQVIGQRMAELTKSTDERLKEISAQVDKRLSEGFEKTTETFNDIVKRLALIDVAQKTITSLSSDVVSLQEVLADKRSRGAFGEVQLAGLVRNVFPENQFSFQHTLSNGKIADCVLFLPEPTGNVVIDSKFPLESYRKMTDNELAEADRNSAVRQFKVDVRKHINDIAYKYLIKNETSDGALMFIPAEAIFAEIHAHHPDVLEIAYKKRVWLASPTTLMAILTTARSVLKDQATQQQVHVIQEHLVHLGSDFNRFRTRFDNLAKHIDQAATDVQQIHTSASKISNRFTKIEKVEMLDVQD
jgi:DNA recombination protein RmuC